MNQQYYTPNQENNQKFRKNNFRHLSLSERINIEKLLKLKKDPNYHGPKITLAYIAKIIGANKSTVFREIKRGTYVDVDPVKGVKRSRYLASFGQGVCDKNIKRSHYKSKLTKDSPELFEIAQLLNSGADPLTALHIYEEKHNEKFPLCEKSIYNYFNRGLLKLRRGTISPRKRKVHKEKTQKMTIKGDNISTRPEIIETREEFGHWEGDLIVGAKNKSKECLFTIVERKTRLYLAFKIKNKEMKTVVGLLNDIENIIGSDNFKNLFRTITFDNGTEFRDFEGMEKSSLSDDMRTKIYYANPYHSWERGSNENANRMMRKFFPKGTNFSNFNDRDIKRATNKINFSVRKLLGTKSAAETLKKLNNKFYEIVELLGLKNPYLKYLAN